MKPTITVVGLGPAGPELITAQTRELLDGDAPVWLRTSRHPAAGGLDVSGTFDELYETSASFSDVYASIVDRLAEEAGIYGALVYAVPGSPNVAEHTVELLRSDQRVDVDIRAALGFADLCWAALGVDPMAEAVTITDAHRILVDAAGRLGPMLVTQVHSSQVLEDVILAFDDVAPDTATILHALGTPDELVLEVPWGELSRSIEPNHLTSLWIPRLAEPVAAAVMKLDELVRLSRSGSASDNPDLATVQDDLVSRFDAVLAALELVATDEDEGYAQLEEALGGLVHVEFELMRVAAENGRFRAVDVFETIAAQLDAGGV